MQVPCSRRQTRSSEPSPAPPPSVIYLIYKHCRGDLYTYSMYALKIVDAENGDTKLLPEPIFRLNKNSFSVGPGFCRNGLKNFYSWVECRRLDRAKTSTCCIHTCLILQSLFLRLPQLMIRRSGPRLNAPKVDPILITFEGRIYAFPRWFSQRSPTTPKCEVPDLETWSLSGGEKHFAIVSDTLCKYDFALEKGLAEGKGLVDLDDENLVAHVDYGVVYPGDKKLCVVRCGLDRPLDHFNDDECRNFISCDIYKARGHRQKKTNLSGLVHLASSTCSMDDNPGFYGLLKACFPMRIVDLGGFVDIGYSMLSLD
ncbi:hypothetical protein QQP08_011424, partial [Theobroma cacao]